MSYRYLLGEGKNRPRYKRDLNIKDETVHLRSLYPASRGDEASLGISITTEKRNKRIRSKARHQGLKELVPFLTKPLPIVKLFLSDPTEWTFG